MVEKINEPKKAKVQGPKARTWLCTLNNPDQKLSEIHIATGAVYTVGQLELGENGTYHFQFVQTFGRQIRLTHYKKVNKNISARPVIVDNGVEKYCMKEDTRIEGPWEFGTRPMNRNSKKDWDDIWLNAKRGNMEEIPSDVRVRCYSNLKKIEKDHIEVKDSDDVRGVWIWGAAGYGKSRMARERFPNAYPKLCNKWWDGYQNQQYVIMDDIGLEHKCLGQQLKIWADRYGCILENKGGAMSSNFKKFVVTSQYSIEQIFEGDQQTIEALRRRFEVIHLPFKMYATINPEFKDSDFDSNENNYLPLNDLDLNN